MRPKTLTNVFGILGLSAALTLSLTSVSVADVATAPATAAATAPVESGHEKHSATTDHKHAAGADKHDHKHESGGEDHGSGDPTEKELSFVTLVATILVFIGLFLVLRFTAWKPIMAGLKNREHAIRESIEAAKKAKADADRTTKELQAQMERAQAQATQQMAQAKVDAVRVAESIRQQAEAEAASLKDRTLREIQAAKQQALTDINTHAATLGVAVARKILQRQVTADDQQRLVEESLSEMAKKN
jgi:F-type H+-transporting ATPase subunit b